MIARITPILFLFFTVNCVKKENIALVTGIGIIDSYSKASVSLLRWGNMKREEFLKRSKASTTETERAAVQRDFEDFKTKETLGYDALDGLTRSIATFKAAVKAYQAGISNDVAKALAELNQAFEHLKVIFELAKIPLEGGP